MPNYKIKKVRRRKRRKRKLRYLRHRLAEAETQLERNRLIAKIRRVSLHASIAEYLAAQRR